MKVLLASRSPQRKALLEALGVEFEVTEPRVEEMTEGDPSEIVLENARWKAASIAAIEAPGTLVIAGDTEVAVDGRALGQPHDEAEANEHLRHLSGREHEVIGAIALMGPGTDEEGLAQAREGVVSTTVRMKALDGPLLDAYLASGEWRGRAGSYAIQGLGSALVEEVSGDLSNVIGLPVALLLELAPELSGGRGEAFQQG
ncbi:MAG TPA: Maf family protein [Solirubrobacterales bacterium]|jgi:septum formation protein|nr:Maf family protein [Solirubrobacterales bacterium]